MSPLNQVWNLIVLHKKKVLAGVAVIALLAASPALTRWSDQTVMPALAENNIFGLTSDLVHRTGEMVEDTRQLENQVAQAQSAMQGLDRQEALLAKQIKTNDSIKEELDRQRSGNVEARERMKDILARQQKTAKLTETAAKTGNEVTAQMSDTVASLGKTAQYTAMVGSSTGNMNERVDVLLDELDRSVENFRYVALIPKLRDTLLDLLNLSDGDKNPTQRPLGEVMKDPAGSLTGQTQEKEKQDEEDGESDGLLSDLLP